MPGATDPLGKRALFWLPVDPEAEGDALLDAPGVVAVDAEPDLSGPPHARPSGRHALFSDAMPATEPERNREAAKTADPVHGRGAVTVACSRCGAVTRVGVLEFLTLHFPVPVWLPGRTFDRRITCPACRHRAWTSVTLTR